MTTFRYVAFNDEHGIFLGIGPHGKMIWSLCEPLLPPTAPTFKDEDEFRAYARGKELPDFRMVQVAADSHNGTRASVEACANSQLPRWAAVTEETLDAGKPETETVEEQTAKANAEQAAQDVSEK